MIPEVQAAPTHAATRSRRPASTGTSITADGGTLLVSGLPAQGYFTPEGHASHAAKLSRWTLAEIPVGIFVTEIRRIGEPVSETTG